MTEQQEQQHHHHHHHHHRDAATAFKRKSLKAIERRKVIERVLKIVVLTIAVLMFIAVVLAYTVG